MIDQFKVEDRKVKALVNKTKASIRTNNKIETTKTLKMKIIVTESEEDLQP